MYNDLAPAPGVTTDQQKDAQQLSKDAQAGITCYTTSCGANCKKGTNAVAQVGGQPSQLSTNPRSEKGVYCTLCCDNGTLIGSCQWRGFRGVGLSCINGCDDGETEVVTGTNHRNNNGDQKCTGWGSFEPIVVGLFGPSLRGTMFNAWPKIARKQQLNRQPKMPY